MVIDLAFSSVVINWEKTSACSISDGRFHIAKCLVNASPRYTLWENTKMIGTWDDAKSAKSEAEKIKNGGMNLV